MVDVKHNSRLQGQYSNFVLAHQVEQVYYMPYPHLSMKSWWVAFKVYPQLLYPSDDVNELQSNTRDDVADVYQEEDVGDAFPISDEAGLNQLGSDVMELSDEEPGPSSTKRKRSLRIQQIQERLNAMSMLRHAKKVFSKARSRSKGSDGGSSSAGSIFQGSVQSRERQLLGCMEEQQEEVEQQAEGQMEADAEEEARADAELAGDPMMDGAETGGPSSSAGTIRFRKTVSIRPRWVGHRTPVNAALGAFCHFYYPGMVTLSNGDQVAVHKWEHWGLKQHVDGDGQGMGGGTCQGTVWKGFWERYRLDGEGDYEKEKMAKRVFQRAATKVVRDSFSNACIQTIVNFHKRVKNINIKKTPEVKKMHLETKELIQEEVDWIMKDPEAWRWICHHWAGSDFQGASDRNRGNRTCKPGMQRFGADGFIGKEQRMEAKSGIKPSFVDVYIEGHKGSDPENPKVLCDEQATEKLAKYKENIIQCHGPEFDWKAAAPDVEAMYYAGGGLPHGRHYLRSSAEMFQSFDLHNLIHRCHLTTSAVLSPKDHHLEMLRVGLDPILQSFDLHNLSHRFHLTTSALLAAKDHHLEMLRVLSLLLTR
ncbi:hypothetical protein U9M48_020046 [Paspalum notatum var. saurae]|uniref:Uncharacterized protein n=1 Tax=Paspalum notatum var. saurae TaxID=547442 RepID=A0AAQ3TDY9_PASNO